jgi:hypothetical protein
MHHTTHRTTELREGCAAMTHTDATCNTHRRNTHRKLMQHATCIDATRDANRCNARRCNMQHAPMQREPKHRCNTHRCDNDDATYTARSTPAACAVHRTPLAAACVRRTVRAIHRPCRTAQHTIPPRADARLALGTRTAVLFEIEPPLNVTAPSTMRTMPPP